MTTELQKLRISKEHKARRDEKRVWPWVVLVILLGGAGVGVWKWEQNSAVVMVETMRVREPEVEKDAGGSGGAAAGAGNKMVVLDATGYVIAAHKIELASRVVGRVSWIGVEMGDKVTKDQILVRLEDDDYKARVLQQTGQLESARARLAELKAGNRPQETAQMKAQWEKAEVEAENAERTYKRLAAIKDARSLSQNEVDDAEATMKEAKAQAESVRQQYELMKEGARKEQIDAQQATVHQLEGGLALANVDLTNTVIHAPIASTVLERNVEVGEFVTNGFVGDRGAKGYVVSLADLNDLEVELDISQNSFAKVYQDQPCWIVTDVYPDRKYEGKVELISPLANRQKATVLVRVRVLHPDDKLKPDMNATVSFLAPPPPPRAEKDATPGVAEKPLVRVRAGVIKDGTAFVVENGKAVRRAVTVGMTAANGEVEVRKGLSVGDDVIVNPPATLKEGDVVKMGAGQ